MIHVPTAKAFIPCLCNALVYLTVDPDWHKQDYATHCIVGLALKDWMGLSPTANRSDMYRKLREFEVRDYGDIYTMIETYLFDLFHESPDFRKLWFTTNRLMALETASKILDQDKEGADPCLLTQISGASLMVESRIRTLRLQ